jgi:phospholipase C
VQTGSSDGKVNNYGYIPWDIITVFDVFSSQNLSWSAYNDGLMPSLTKVMFLRKYFDNHTNFADVDAFETACAQAADAPTDQKPPCLSFVEPNFGVVGHDQSYHPPHDIRAG